MLRAIIVEDESIARQVLRNYIEKYCPMVHVIGESEDANQAIEMIERMEPELVFLDVEMPFGNGFDVLQRCKLKNFETIFITAYSEYAIKAINHAAAYYLMKPINIEALIIAVDRASELISKKQLFNKNQIIVDNISEKSSLKKQIVLPTMEGYDVIKVEQILRMQGNGNFTDIYLKDKTKKMACRFLKHFEELLPKSFMRVHKSHIINISSVISYHKGSGGYVILEDGSEVEVSASYKEEFLGRLM
jgi:two-component system, LytTR family, response regulator